MRFLCVFLTSILFPFASTLVHETNQHDREKVNEVQSILHNLLVQVAEEHSKELVQDVIFPQKHTTEDKLEQNLNNTQNGCACVKTNCGCCARIKVESLKLDQTACVNVSYLPADYGISLTVTLGSFTLINETVSVSEVDHPEILPFGKRLKPNFKKRIRLTRNPPPLCADIPHLKQEASICIVLHDLQFSKSSLKGCVALEVRLITVIKERYELGCFTIPPVINEKNGPYIPLQQQQQQNKELRDSNLFLNKP